MSNLQRHLSRKYLANGFNFDVTLELTFCEACPQGKQHRTKFSSSGVEGQMIF